MQPYQPLCEHCRSHSQFIFRVGCPGCETRRARIAAEHKAVSDAQAHVRQQRLPAADRGADRGQLCARRATLREDRSVTNSISNLLTSQGGANLKSIALDPWQLPQAFRHFPICID
jgi:hypothetical protein